MKVKPEEVQKSIMEVMKLAHPAKQTHADMAARLTWRANAHRIAMNMDALAKRGVLDIDPRGSTTPSTKRYGLKSPALT